MSTETMTYKENAQARFSGVTILPYQGGALPYAGFDKQEIPMVIHDGVSQTDHPMFFDVGGLITCVTGLNEKGIEVTGIKNKDLRDQKVKEIRTFIARCEKEIAGNYDSKLDNIEDEAQFYSAVHNFKSVFRAEYITGIDGIKRYAPTYFDELKLELRNEGYTLNSNDVRDRLKQYIIEAGGYGLIAPSLERAKEGNYAFYLDKAAETAKENSSIYIRRDEAGALLNLMFKKNSNRLFYVTKMISGNPLQWRTGQNATPLELLYMECTKYINGEGIDRKKGEAIDRFILLAEMDMDDLKIDCYINDGFRMGLLSSSSDGVITHVPSGTTMGRGKPNVFAYLKAGGESEPVYNALQKDVEAEWKDN